MTDRLDEILRDDARRTLPDTGFSARVLEALPAPSPRPPWLQPALVLGSALVGSVLAAALAPGDMGVVQGFADLMHLQLFTPAAVTGLAMAAALLVSAVVLAAETE